MFRIREVRVNLLPLLATLPRWYFVRALCMSAMWQCLVSILVLLQCLFCHGMLGQVGLTVCLNIEHEETRKTPKKLKAAISATKNFAQESCQSNNFNQNLLL